MKKIFATIIALAMVLAMSVTAFAAEDTGNKPGDSQDIDVTAKTESSTTTPTVYSVDISWDSMTFTYSESGTKTWNPENHTFTTSTSGGWDKTTANVTVTNHSNATVDVAVTYSAVDGTGVTGTITNGTKTLAAGVENAYDAADKLVATLTISGEPTATVTSEGVKVGSITVKIS